MARYNRYTSDEERAAARKKQRQQDPMRRRKHESVHPGGIKDFIDDGSRRGPVPPEVLAERDRRIAREMAVPLTPNVAVLGDPPAGRSALDMRARG